MNDRMFGSRCTRCLKDAHALMLFPFMDGMLVTLCGVCIKELVIAGVISEKAKGSIVKPKKGGGDKTS